MRHAVTAAVLTIATMNHTTSQVDTSAMLQELADVPAATDQTLPPLLARKSRMYRSSSSR